MKKFLVIAVALMLCTSAAFAQNKGDKYIGGYIGVNHQNVSIDSASANDTSFGFHLEYGEFIANRVLLGANVGYAYDSETNAYTVTIGGAYYVPLCEKLYYTPGIGFGAAFGTSASISEVASGFGVSASLFSLEFKPTQHFSISASIVSLDYIWLTYGGYAINTLNFNFGLNPTVGFKYYF